MGVVYAFSFANSERSMTPMRFDDHRKIVGTGFNTDPQDAMEPDAASSMTKRKERPGGTKRVRPDVRERLQPPR